MKSLQSTKPVVSIEELFEGMKEAIKNYLDFANKSRRTGSNIIDAVNAGFLDYNLEDNMDYYIQITALALQVLAKPAVGAQFEKEMGEHYYEKFIALLSTIPKFINWLNTDANIAELKYADYEMESPNAHHEIHYIHEKRKYEAMLHVLIENKKEWDEHDKKHWLK